jgi:ABC-type transport system involved in cytochrome bd biosynthesis fused ATPase/permease subunit
MTSIYTLFNNKWMKALLLVVLLQQLLVASGTYFLGTLTADFPTEGLQLGTALLMLVCIILPGTVFHYGLTWCTTKACKLTQQDYLKCYIQANFNHPTHWRNEKSREARHDMMCRSGQESVQSAVHFFGDFAATSLNIILNTISIILVTDITQGVVILVAGLLGLGIIHLNKKGISETSRNEVLADNRLNGHLSRSWDNIILGNQIFFDRWKMQFDDLFSTSERAAEQTVNKRDWSVSIAALVTNGLVLGSALLLIWTHQKNTAFALAMLVMLPRSLQTVMHIQIIQSYFASWKNLQEKLAVTSESLAKPQPMDLSSYITPEVILVTESRDATIFDIETHLESSSRGRFTITGQNGSGKSSLLLNLKNKFGLSAIYIPAQHQLFLNDSQVTLSSGELTLAMFQNLKEVDCEILLLDEWDANLSMENRSILDNVIDEISLSRIVVEIRHSKLQLAGV